MIANGSLQREKKIYPISPIVSTVSSPTYKLCQYFDTWFKNTNFEPAHSVKNTRTLSQQNLKSSYPQHTPCFLQSYQSVYVCTLNPHTYHIQITDFLTQSGLMPPIVDEFIDSQYVLTIISVNLITNFIHFPMAFPCGHYWDPLLAKIFMNPLELSLIHISEPTRPY